MAKRNPDELPDELVTGALDVLGKDLPEHGADVVEASLVDDEDREVPKDLVFTTKKKTADDDADDDVLEIDLDGEMLYARKPSKGAFTLLLGAVSRSASAADKTQAILEFTFASFDEVGRMRIKNRLFDSADDFDADDLSEIVSQLITKWAPAQSRKQRRAALRVARS